MTEQDSVAAPQTAPEPQAPQVAAPAVAKPILPKNEDGTFAPQSRREKGRNAVRRYFAEQAQTRLGSLAGEPAAPAVQATEQPVAEAAKAVEPQVTPEPQESVDPEQLASGVAALKRLGLPAKMIETFSRTELAAYGAKAAKEIAANAELSRELGELRKGTKATAPVKAASDTSEQPALDLEAMKKRLAPVLDEEAVDVLVDSLKGVNSLIDSLRAQNKALSEKFAEELKPIHTDRITSLVEKARAGLSERFPQLSEASVFEGKVVARMAKLNQPDADGNRPYSDVQELMLHACRIELDEKPAARNQPAPKPRTSAPVLSSNTMRPTTRPKNVREVARLAWDNRHLSDRDLDAKLRGAVS